MKSPGRRKPMFKKTFSSQQREEPLSVSNCSHYSPELTSLEMIELGPATLREAHTRLEKVLPGPQVPPPYHPFKGQF